VIRTSSDGSLEGSSEGKRLGSSLGYLLGSSDGYCKSKNGNVSFNVGSDLPNSSDTYETLYLPIQMAGLSGEH